MSTEELDKRIDKALSGWETPSKQSKDAIWQFVSKEIGATNNRLVLVDKWKWIAAASLALILISSTIFYNSTIEYSSQVGENIAVQLPDGSSLILNAESKASINSISWIFSRSVKLTGEAFFEVKKGSQFSVKSTNGTIRVLGTSFNVFSRGTNFQVECFTGKVEINNAINKIVISEGEKVNQIENLQLKKENILQNVLEPRWLNGDYTYAKVKLKVVLEDISTHYGVRISASSKIKKMNFTGEWNKKMTLEDVLKIVSLPFNLETKTISNKEIELQSIE